MTEQPKLEIDWLELIKSLVELVLPRSDDLLSSPAKLGSLLIICANFAEIEPIVRERATTLAMQRKEIPGWTLVHHDGNRYVTKESVLELVLGCPVVKLGSLLAAVATQLGNISQAKYELLCEAAGTPPAEQAVQQTGATVFLRRDPK